MVQVCEKGMINGSEVREQKGSTVSHQESLGTCREMTGKETQ